MQIGLATVATDDMIPFPQLAQEAERRGFAWMLTGEHSHLPLGARVWSGGGDLPDYYRRIVDPFVACGAAAAVTERIGLGTAVSVVPYHDPIFLAKACSTVDLISGGRFVFGIGAGYIPLEAENHGIKFSSRREIMREKMRAVTRLWSEDVVSFSGEFASFKEVQMYPKPVQRPRPPVLLGGQLSKSTLADIVEYGDGWMPTAMMASDLEADVVHLRHAAEDAGRDPASLEIAVIHSEKTGAERSTDRWEKVLIDEQAVAEYEGAGATKVICLVPSVGGDEVFRVLDQYTEALSSLLSPAAT